MRKEPEFEVEVYRTAAYGASGTLSMPVTQSEYHDAFEKARINSLKDDYIKEILNVKREFLAPHITDSVDILQMNLLALRLTMLDSDQLARFQGLVKVDELTGKCKPIPMHRLINMTFSLDNCPVAYGVRTDEALGKFLYENDMLSDEDHQAATVKSNISMYADEFFALLGKKHRTQENGVFTVIGYIENGGIDTMYKRGEMACFDCSGADVVLNIFKGDGPSTTLGFPINYEDKLRSALEKAGADSLDECGYECADCRIPSAKELIDQAKNIRLVKEFAQALYVMLRSTEPVVYKAILEATECGDLAATITLTRDVDSYVLHSQMVYPSDYAKENFQRLKSKDDGVNLAEFVNMHECGRKLMEHDNAIETTYGILLRKDGEPIQTASPTNSNPVMTM